MEKKCKLFKSWLPILVVFCLGITKANAQCTEITGVTVTPSATQIKYLDALGLPQTPADNHTVFTATAIGGAATAYEWYVDGALQLGQTANTFSYVTPSRKGVYNVYAAAVNGCTESNRAKSRIIAVIVIEECPAAPAQPSAITGPTCVTSITNHTNLVYSVTNVPGVVYNWTLPAGWTQVSGGNSNSITVTAGGTATGNVTISVRASNGCSMSAPRVSPSIFYQNIPLPVFAPYNLGADPAYDNPKSQMQYLATAHSGNLDGRVYGGRYQWGRDNAGNYAIRPTNYALYQGNGVANRSVLLNNGATYELISGQILTNPGTGVDLTNRADTVHVYAGSAQNYDWRGTNRRDDLWGNGLGVATRTDNLGFSDPGILQSNGTAYQSTSWAIPGNNPCPVGWRVPTQDEWERLGNYGCNAQNAVSGELLLTAASQIWTTTTTGFTWVRVTNGRPFSGTWAANTGNGYAVYRTDDWNLAIAAGGYFAGLLQDGTNIATVFASKRLYDVEAPMPFIFLPAAGNRGDASGALNAVGTVGHYWTSTPAGGQYVYQMSFNSSSVADHRNSYNRAFGLSVRCVAADPFGPVATTIRLTSAPGTDNQSVCLGSALTTIAYATTGAAGASFNGLPAGVTGTFSGNYVAGMITISGTPAGTGTFNYTVTITDSEGDPVTATGIITVNPVPAQPSAITGSTCVTAITHTSLTYSVTNAAGMVYNWTLPNGWTQLSGGTGNSITVAPGGTATGSLTISVTASNAHACASAPSVANFFYQNIPVPVFAAHNLGADPAYDNPKAQMQYLATAHAGNLDGRVYGGRFQWGRDNAGNYAIHPNNYTLYQGDGVANRAVSLAAGATYAPITGQIITNPGTGVSLTLRADTVHVYNSASPFDWRGTNRLDNLWGNGQNAGTPTNGLGLNSPGILQSNGSYYQSTSWVIPGNNPCPNGWRVPTQDEWERLGNYGCDAQNAAGGSFSISTSNQIWNTTATGFTWVRVSNGLPLLGNWAANAGNGYAVYRTDDWNAAVAAGGYFAGLLQNGTNIATVFASKRLYDTDAPVPFLFLPAAGFRNNNNGSLSNVGTNGFYWSSTPSGNNAHALNFDSGNINPHLAYARANGYSLRCVKDDTPYLNVVPSSLTYTHTANGGGAQSVTVNTNQPSWTVSSNQPWVTVPAGAQTSASFNVAITAANNSAAPRSATVTVSAGGLTATVIVTQAGNPGVNPDDPCANPCTNKERLFCYLKSNYGLNIISGQMDIDYYLDTDMVDTVYQHTGKYPAIKGFDFMQTHPYYTGAPYYRGQQQIKEAIHWWNGRGGYEAGGRDYYTAMFPDRPELHGIVTFCWHWRQQQVVGPEPAYYTSRGNPNHYTNFVIPWRDNQLDTASADFALIKRDLIHVGGLLQQLKDLEIPVLWRPLHEASGQQAGTNSWFWWGARGPAPYKALWQYIYDYLAVERGFDNLIWVWNGEHDDWFPDDPSTVDIVSYDRYGPPGQTNLSFKPIFDATLNMVPPEHRDRMIVALTENGIMPNPDRCFDEGAPWSWFMTWVNADGGHFWTAHNPLSHRQAVYNHPQVITFEDLEDLTTYGGPPCTTGPEPEPCECVCVGCSCTDQMEIPVPAGSPKTLVSAGKRTRTSTGGTAPQLVDGRYRAVNGDSNSWSGGTNTWVSIEVGSGPCELILLWTACANSDHIIEGGVTNYGAPTAYRIYTSANSTNGADGSWTPVLTVNNNPIYRVRTHKVPFCGQRWVRFEVLGGNASIYEIELHDNSKGDVEGWLFFGDSITAESFHRGSSRIPAFSTLVWQADPTRYPMQINGGYGFEQANDISSPNRTGSIHRLRQTLDENDGIKVVTIGLGTNDFGQSTVTFANNMRILINAARERGKTVVLPSIPYARGRSIATQQAMNQVINNLRIEFNLPTGPDLYTLFSAGSATLFRDDLHPNDLGAREINRLWALAAADIPKPCAATGGSGSNSPWTYTSYTPQDVAAVAGRRVFFAHNSVGEDVLNGLASLGTGLTIVPNSIQATTTGIHERALDNNGNPIAKLNTFQTMMANGGRNAQIAFLKFCYSDFTNSTNAVSLFNSYKTMLATLQTTYPSVTFVHVTAPLYAVGSSWQNGIRHEFNELMRDEYKGLVFDLAAMEAVDEDGNPAPYALSPSPPGTPTLWSGWTYDGGHLNTAGGQRMARALISFLAQVPLR